MKGMGLFTVDALNHHAWSPKAPLEIPWESFVFFEFIASHYRQVFYFVSQPGFDYLSVFNKYNYYQSKLLKRVIF